MLATIGYQDSSLDDFIATLHAAKVKILVDVRQVPVSRRKGFSKGTLKIALDDAGIEYVHLVGLGDPKEGRIAAREGRFEDFLKIFKAHLKTPEARADLENAASIANEGGACLMCYERVSKHCHRRLVADSLSDMIGIEVKHLGVREGIAKNGSARRSRTRPNARQGAAACG